MDDDYRIGLYQCVLIVAAGLVVAWLIMDWETIRSVMR